MLRSRVPAPIVCWQVELLQRQLHLSLPPPRDPNSAYPFSTQDPHLSQAENLPMEECKELMIQFLQAARRNGSSDAHLSADAYPFVRHFV